jgi:hypothetical protein
LTTVGGWRFLAAAADAPGSPLADLMMIRGGVVVVDHGVQVGVLHGGGSFLLKAGRWERAGGRAVLRICSTLSAAAISAMPSTRTTAAPVTVVTSVRAATDHEGGDRTGQGQRGNQGDQSQGDGLGEQGRWIGAGRAAPPGPGVDPTIDLLRQR